MKSHAQRAQMELCLPSTENKSVHFSIVTIEQDGRQKSTHVNFQISAIQVSALIYSLQEAKKILQNAGIDTGEGQVFFPPMPYEFYKDLVEGTKNGSPEVVD